MPLAMFSAAMTSKRPPSTGVACTSLTKPQSNAGTTRPRQHAAAVHGEPPEAEVAHHLQHAEGEQRAPKAQAQHQGAAEQRAADRQPQADHLVDDADLGRRVAHALQQERRHQRPGEGVAELVEDDEGEERRRARLSEVVAQAADQRLEPGRARRPRGQRHGDGDAGAAARPGRASGRAGTKALARRRPTPRRWPARQAGRAGR